MPTSVLLVTGVVAIVVAAALLWATARLRREVDAAERLLRRARLAVDEVERVDAARRQLTGIPYTIFGWRRRGNDS